MDEGAAGIVRACGQARSPNRQSRRACLRQRRRPVLREQLRHRLSRQLRQFPAPKATSLSRSGSRKKRTSLPKTATGQRQTRPTRRRVRSRGAEEDGTVSASCKPTASTPKASSGPACRHPPRHCVRNSAWSSPGKPRPVDSRDLGRTQSRTGSITPTT